MVVDGEEAVVVLQITVEEVEAVTKGLLVVVSAAEEVPLRDLTSITQVDKANNRKGNPKVNPKVSISKGVRRHPASPDFLPNHTLR